MSYQDRAEEIATRIRNLGGSGQVHARTRFTGDWGTFIEQFRDPDMDRICGWMITRKEADEGEARNHDVETWHLVGFTSVCDEDETDFLNQQRVDDVRDHFRANPNLSFGEVARVPRLLEADERFFGASVLCHVADVELRVVVRS